MQHGRRLALAGGLLLGLAGLVAVGLAVGRAVPVHFTFPPSLDSRLTLSQGVDATNQAVGVTTIFTPTATVYAVGVARNITPGTTLFARWFHDGQVYEDSSLLTAATAYPASYVAFHLSPAPGKPYPLGSYTVQFFLNGRAGPQVDYQVQATP